MTSHSLPQPKFAYLVAAICLGIAGCQNESDNSAALDVDASVSLTQTASTASACCGQCAQQSTVSAVNGGSCCGQSAAGATVSSVGKEGCCGQCAEESAAADKGGCCGQCGGAQQPVSDESATSCENGCHACVEGNTTDCQCGDQTSAASAPSSPEQPSSQQPSDTPPSFAEDRDTFHFLLSNHQSITRTVTEREDGVETLTESVDPKIVKKIQEHVASMYQRVEDVRPIRMRDPLYRELFQHTDKIEMTLTQTDNGIRVTETSQDPYVVKLIQAHAKVVTGFIDRGFEEARLNHTPPTR